MTWVTLTPDQMQVGIGWGTARELEARLNNRKPGNNARYDHDTAVRMHRLGTCGEIAAKEWLGCSYREWVPIQYGVCEEPDLAGFIDAKTPTSDSYELNVPAHNLKLDWAYLLVLGDQRPRFCIRGWAWGHEFKTIKEWVPGRPTYTIVQSDLRPPHELKDEYDRRKRSER